MFDPAAFASLRAAVEHAVDQPLALATGEQKRDALRALSALRDTVDGALATGLADLAETEGHLDDGAPTALAWARVHLRLDHAAARRLIAAGRTLGQLDQVASAAREGAIRLEHVAALTTAVTTLGVETVADAQDWLVPVARTADPAELRQLVRSLREVIDPESLDAAYERGMDRSDVQLGATTGGFHLTGFLDPVTGAAFRAWLSAAAAPTDADDARSASQRRVQAVHDLVTGVLEHGLPTDNGVRPAICVDVDAETLAGDPLGAAGRVRGYGAIGPALLEQLVCDAEATAVVTGGDTGGPTPQAHVLDVGRSLRLATRRQRIAVAYRQGGRCATPGCGGTHLKIHHVEFWSDGGPTDLANLIGLCSRCHALVHLERLHIEADGHGGFVVSTGGSRRRRRTLDDHRRLTDLTVRRRLRALRAAVRAGVGDPPRSRRPVAGTDPRRRFATTLPPPPSTCSTPVRRLRT